MLYVRYVPSQTTDRISRFLEKVILQESKRLQFNEENFCLVLIPFGLEMNYDTCTSSFNSFPSSSSFYRQNFLPWRGDKLNESLLSAWLTLSLYFSSRFFNFIVESLTSLESYISFLSKLRYQHF